MPQAVEDREEKSGSSQGRTERPSSSPAAPISHTPGPWSWVERDGMRCLKPGVLWLNESAGSGGIWGDEIDKANARLIAAAPTMFAALDAADEALAQFTAFEADARAIMGNTNFNIVQLRRAEVRAAIAKALGASTASPAVQSVLPRDDGKPSKEEADFTARFVARMIAVVTAGGGDTHGLEEYAVQAARAAYEDPQQREDGPEDCADNDISYWEA